MRITKKYDERRQEFMDISLALFAEHGIDEVSVNDIIKKANVAKGTFYHYFESKQVLIEEIMNEQIQIFTTSISKILKDENKSFCARLKAVILEVLNSEVDFLLIDSINNPKNHTLHDDYILKGVDNCVELLADFMKEGAKQGIIKARHTRELIYITVLGVNSITRVFLDKEGKKHNELINDENIKLLLEVTEESILI